MDNDKNNIELTEIRKILKKIESSLSWAVVWLFCIAIGTCSTSHIKISDTHEHTHQEIQQ